MRTGILGGSFNPPHNGHIAMAKAARDARNLDRIWLLIAARPPHKSDSELAPHAHRLQMALLAASTLPFLEVNNIEANLPGISYTYRTIEVISESEPEDELFFILGADTVPELATWKNADRIFELAEPIVIPRTGFHLENIESLHGKLSKNTIKKIKKNYLPVEPVDISSTYIRQKAAAGEKVKELVPEPVAGYIHSHGLYGCAG